MQNAIVLSAKIDIDEINEQTPDKVLDLLNRVYSVVENRSEQLGCEVIKKNANNSLLIIGGLYPGKQKIKSHEIHFFFKGVFDELTPAEQIVELALAIHRAVSYSNIRAENKIAISVKIGITCGPITLGLTGLSGLSNKYNYDAWGQTVEIAHKLAQSAPSNAIVVSDEAYFYIANRRFVLEPMTTSTHMKMYTVVVPEVEKVTTFLEPTTVESAMSIPPV